MNIAFFLLPKHEVAFVTLDATLRQVIERMEHHQYTAIPIIDKEGQYAGTVTEGDILWHMKRSEGRITFENASRFMLKELPLRMNNKPVSIESDMADLINLSKTQNFVPVVDDRGRFIGIVRRSQIIEYCAGFVPRQNVESQST
ncbi:CBS domain-containing protein [Saccharibacillus endophyticus]|uniref:Inosine-5-monophosphate dehydrogenase n=1 Tax=Saccharibacillus endophyticus TaxID=2060666 RepID=A0ABQ2A3L7_9BACL|nr:CBS domain-containing protein [Saccharibacillus endophyticus]GGH85467.1 inosine-5-monophosphate dehydrogenase [Saccharibacillus endophyticus]